MGGYKKILLALDFSESTAKLCERGTDLMRHYSAQVHLVHVVEPIIVDPSYDGFLPLPLDFEAQMQEKARLQLFRWADSMRLSRDACHVRQGATKGEILGLAEMLATDLIVVGSHGRSGVGLLLGSTANAVLHSARCDVLAVRIF